MSNDELKMELEEAKQRITQLERKLEALNQNEKRSLPNTQILSENFLARAFAIYGHVLVAGFIIAIPLWCLTFLLGNF